MLIIDRASVWMLRDTQVWPRPTAILVPDVALTDVASQYDDLLGGLEDSGLAVPHRGLRGALGCSRRCLPGEALLKQPLQAGCRLVLAAQNKELRVAAEPRTQSGWLTADFTVARRGAALEPQVSLAIELILQVMSERFRR
jgi:hypothetical protein